ncbi:MAG: TetR/AcrR family transcriptional regulator, partial [Acidimicrobiia bacterium]
MPKLDARTVAEHRRQVLDRLYRSFEALIYERGYDAINLADIAQMSDMARTAIYHYYPDKEALLLAYTAHEMDEY